MTDTIPRLMLAALTDYADVRSMTLALAAALGRSGYQPQLYRTISFAEASDCMRPLFGLATRHLDLWILGPQRCREVFARTATLVDIALVEACPDAPDPQCVWQLARTLDCPVLGVVTADDVVDPRVPLALPPGQTVDGLLIDGIEQEKLAELERAALERCCCPLLGGIDSNSLKPDGTHPDSGRRLHNLAMLLSESFLAFSSIDQLVRLAESRPFAMPPPAPEPRFSCRRPTVAVAWDDAFCRYLPDALDELEAAGACVTDFAPASCETLPPDADVILIGAGELTPEYLRRFADNVCIQSALRAHVRQGKPLYAEGAGAALLCQHVRLSDGSSWPMTGILPATLVQHEPEPGLTRVEFEPTGDCWIFEAGTPYRGYRSRQWRFDELEDVDVLARARGNGQPLVLRRKNCLASIVHINFAALPQQVNRALSLYCSGDSLV